MIGLSSYNLKWCRRKWDSGGWSSQGSRNAALVGRAVRIVAQPGTGATRLALLEPDVIVPPNGGPLPEVRRVRDPLVRHLGFSRQDELRADRRGRAVLPNRHDHVNGGGGVLDHRADIDGQVRFGQPDDGGELIGGGRIRLPVRGAP